MDLGDVAGGADVADAQRESRVELRGIDEMEEGALGINAGDHGFGGNFATGGAGSLGDSAGQRAESAVGKGGRADRMRIGSGAEKKDGGAAGRPRSERRAENAASGDRGAKEFGFEEFGDEVRYGHGTPAE